MAEQLQPAQDDAGALDNSASLPRDASKALKKFVRRNRPDVDRNGLALKFKSSSPSVSPRRGSSTPQREVGSEDPVTKELQPFNIFEDVTQERLREFEQLFAQSRQSSNYDEFKQKTRRHDPNKFSTCCAVSTDDKGQTNLT